MPEKPIQELVVAFAGPLVNVVIAVILIVELAFTFGASDFDSTLVLYESNFVFRLTVINRGLFLFDLIPAFPMDGGRIFRALRGFWLHHAKATQIAATVGQVLAVGFIAWGFYGNPFMILIGLF